MSRTRWENRERDDRVVFRTHWIFLVPRLAAWVPFLVLTTAFVVLVKPHQWILRLLPLAPLLAIVRIIIDWRQRLFVFHGGRLYVPAGPLHLQQRVLNFPFQNWTLVQSFLGKLLDYGDVEIGMGANPERLECVGRFEAFIEALDVLRQQQAAQQSPPTQWQQQAVVFMFPRPPGDGAIPPAPRRPAHVQTYLPEDRGYMYQGTLLDVDVPSYAGFLAFCDEFVLRQHNWATWYYITADPSRHYYPYGIGQYAARYYLDLLERARIIRGANNGDNGWVSPRIRKLEDIKKRVPYFDRLQPTNGQGQSLRSPLRDKEVHNESENNLPGRHRRAGHRFGRHQRGHRSGRPKRSRESGSLPPGRAGGDSGDGQSHGRPARSAD